MHTRSFKKQWGLVAIVTPLASTKHNCSGTLILEMITRLVASHNTNLLSMAFNFAALVYDKPDEQAWLMERFEMYKKDLEESYIYQQILREGREEGREEGQRESLRETLVGFLNARYPMLVELAREQISGITEIKQLQEILNRVFYLQTAGEIEEYLLSLHDDAAKN